VVVVAEVMSASALPAVAVAVAGHVRILESP
jgi:hypothetical protein